jgi:hypothetical protein
MNSRCVGSLLVRRAPIFLVAVPCLLALGFLFPERAVSEEAPPANDKPAAKIEEVSPEERLKRVIALGATKESEAALQNGLRWLASVQDTDGGWNFATQKINGAVTDPGTANEARNGATGLALLPFLAAGYTHTVDGPYKKTVYKGLEFLAVNYNKKLSNAATGVYAWHETQGTMYSHGLATAALCEAYALTKDKELLPYAEGGLKFLSVSQDPNGGGWRYQPRQPGDTSVLGWQLQALKSGAMAELKLDPAMMTKLIAFLDAASDPKENRAFYGYTGPGKGPATTSIGLLCRIHTGWKKDDPGLKTGVEFLAKMGPHKTNTYFNYYATEVMHQYGGEEWQNWNAALLPQLLDTQEKAGPDGGSWHPGSMDHSTEKGGRLYNTALSCLMLEVYYRYPRVLEKKTGESGGLVY